LAYAVDTDDFMLTPLNHAATLPANVQYACTHASGEYLYVVSSNGGPGIAGDRHYLSSFRIDSHLSALRPHGGHVALRHRPIHITTDGPGEHALIAYNDPSTATVHRIEQDGRLGAQVPQPEGLDTGVFAHQICVASSNTAAILVTRGNDATGDRPEEPGALKIFKYSNGVLTNRCSVAPGGGQGFGPRNLEFGPRNDWIYVSLERQNKLSVFRFDGETIDSAPVFQCDTLVDPRREHAMQIAGAVHVHPGGRFVYVANRALAGGENSIAVYEIDEETGRPHMRQSIDTRGVSPRTFSLDPDGRMLVTANSQSHPSLSVFSIGGDGRLAFERRYDVDSSQERLFWSAMVCARAK
jgi:6-phosphogluconolactonase (cycloisomerase 2 family)